MAGAGGNHELVALAQQDQDTAGVNQSSSVLRDQLEDPLQVGVAADRMGDVSGCLERLHRPLEPPPPKFAALIQPSVVNRSRRPLGKHDDCLLVLVGELSASLLLREVE